MYSTRSKRKRKRRPSATSRLAGGVIERPGTIARHGNKASEMQVTHGSDNDSRM